MSAELTSLIATLRDDLARLVEAPSQEALDRLYEGAQRLESLAEDHKARNLIDASFAFSVFLSTFAFSTHLPDDRQIEKMRLLFTEIEQYGGSETAPLPSPSILFYVGDTQLLPFGFHELCAKHGLELRNLDDSREAKRALEEVDEAVLLFDGRGLERLRGQFPGGLRATKLRRAVSLSPQLETDMRDALSGFGAEHCFVSPTVSSELLRALFPERFASLSPGPKASARPMDNARPRVIIVDDDESQAEFSAAILSNAGMDTLALDDPRDVLSLAAEFRPDLVLIDLYMPEISGEELTAMLRERPEFAELPLLYLSGESERERQDLALTAGADGFIEKPIRPKKLIAAVRERLAAPPSERASSETPQPEQRLQQHLSRQWERDFNIVSLALHAEFGEETRVDEQALSRLLERLNRRLGDRGLLEMVAASHLRGVLHSRSLKSAILVAENLHGVLASALAPARRIPDTVILRTGLCHIDDPNATTAWERARAACERGDGKQCAVDDTTRRQLLKQQFNAIDRRLRGGQPPPIEQRALHSGLDDQIIATIVYPNLPEVVEKRWSGIGIARAPLPTETRLRLDRGLLATSLDALRGARRRGEPDRLLIPQSGEVLKEPGQAEWLRDLLRDRQQLGNGLVCLFPMAEISRDLSLSRAYIEQLEALGIRGAAFDVGLQPTAFRIASHLGLEQLILSPRAMREDVSRIKQFFEHREQCRAAVILPYSDDVAALGRLIGADGYIGEVQAEIHA